MGLTASLQIGRSALAASQLAIQVAGDNLANAATPGFSRRVATLTPAPGGGGVGGVGAGRGVQLADISRRVDQSLLTRLRASVSDQQAAQVSSDLFSQLESITNDLSDSGLSAQLNDFYNVFSELSNNPNSAETKSLVIDKGVALASNLQGLRSNLISMRAQIDDQLGGTVRRANDLLTQIASINVSISSSELGATENTALRDQRDSMLEELSTLIDITSVEQKNGSVNVFVGSSPIVQASTSRGLAFKLESENGKLVGKVVLPTGLEEVIKPTSGKIGGLLANRSGAVDQTISDLDSLTSSLIFEVNKIHSAGRSYPGLTATTSELKVLIPDQTLALNDPTNVSISSLPFAAGNGSFEVLVTNKATGQTQTISIDIDLDGVDNTGAPGFTDDTTVTDIQQALNGVPNLNATLGSDGRISITANAGFEFGFGSDSSGALAVLGINTYFTGTNAQDVGIRQELQDNPQLLVAGKQEGSNEAAQAIVKLQEKTLGTLKGASISEFWRRVVGTNAVSGASAKIRTESESLVLGSLMAQRSSVSGVSIDEEAINLLTFQKQFQASARFIATIDELTQTLLSLV